MNDSQGNDNNTCVVCFKNVTYFSIGECDHPVCFECSTRMRVLCLQNECPICRHDLSRVIFTNSVQPFKELHRKAIAEKLFERQFKIGFCNEQIKEAYEMLLENRCKLCEKIPPFRTFGALSDHMRKAHERYFCDLCVKHLKIFTSERRCYTRQELAHHRRKGDVDDTSHRGHPLCEFCEERFMDPDDLYRHLRKEHLYCHLCDADGRNLYYASHSALAHHFRTDHYLCEEGECAGQHLTAVFRSEIDLIAHKASVHGKGLARAAARQARTLELQFNITPHQVAARAHQRPPRSPSPAQSPPRFAGPSIDTASVEQFPRLSAVQPSPVLLAAPARQLNYGPGGLTRNDRNFPALDGSKPVAAGPSQKQGPAAAAVLRNSKPSVSIHMHSQPASASNFRLTQPTGNRISVPAPKKQPLFDDDFPSLGPNDDHPSIGAATLQPPKMTLINSEEMQAMKGTKTPKQSKKVPLSAEAFPALSSSKAPAAPPQWIKAAPRPRPDPPRPAPPPKAEFNPAADFPTLPANNKSKAKKPAPAPQLPPPQTDYGAKAKKDKKKNTNSNNNKKENISSLTGVQPSSDRSARDSASVLASVNNNQSATVPDNKIRTVEAGERQGAGGRGDFSLQGKEYPPLGKEYPPLGKEYPPLGKASKSAAKVNGAPPGFGKARPACDGMTFTNSSGQTFPAPVHSYVPPPQFEARNRALVAKFALALGGAPAVEDFKVASRAFRDGIIGADEFYEHCSQALGARLADVFPELVALLPDIGKQQELVVGRAVGLAVCADCGQLLAPADLAPHRAAHWPPLAR